MRDQICLASCRHLSSLATWPASAMHSSWCLGWWASVRPCSLSATYTNLSSVSELLLEDEEQQSCTRFWCPLRSLKYRKGCSRVQQEQLEIAMFQIRPLFIGTGNEPINLFCFCDCRDKNCLFLRPMYYLLATSDITITLLEPWHAWISVEYPCYGVIYIFSKAYNNRSVETMPEAGSFVPCIIFFLVHCGVLELYTSIDFWYSCRVFALLLLSAMLS